MKIWQTLFNKFIHLSHDSKIWSNYLPIMPWYLHILAATVALLMSYTFFITNPLSRVVKIMIIIFGLGTLLLWLAIYKLLQIRWNRRSATRDELISEVDWRGDEVVLDIGCGTGLILNQLAKQVPAGSALGIDIWKGQSGGGSYKLLMENARRENVAHKIEVEEVDALNMPFEDESFDAVFSNSAVHHMVRGLEDFEKLSADLRRIVKPGGKLVISDITHLIEALTICMQQAGWQFEVKPATPLLKQYEHKLMIAHKPAINIRV